MTPAAVDILANLSRLTELRLRVQEDATLGVVTIDVAGLPEGCSVIVAPSAALDLAWQIIRAVIKLREAEAGPYSSTF